MLNLHADISKDYYDIKIIKHSAKNMLALNYYKLWIYYFHLEMWNAAILKLVPEIK